MLKCSHNAKSPKGNKNKDMPTTHTNTAFHPTQPPSTLHPPDVKLWALPVDSSQQSSRPNDPWVTDDDGSCTLQSPCGRPLKSCDRQIVTQTNKLTHRKSHQIVSVCFCVCVSAPVQAAPAAQVHFCNAKSAPPTNGPAKRPDLHTCRDPTQRANYFCGNGECSLVQ